MDTRRFEPVLPLPGGAPGCWQRAAGPLRECLFANDLPPTARWLVIDGYEGIARATGATLDEALAKWREDVVRVEPLPPGSRKMVTLPVQQKVEPIPEEDIPEAGEYEDPDGKFKVFSTGMLHFDFAAPSPAPPRTDAPPPPMWPEPHPGTTPAVAVPLPPAPEIPEAYRAAGFTRVARLCGNFGDVGHAFVRDDAQGFTMVGEGVVDLIEPTAVDTEIAAFVAEDRAWIEKLPPRLRRQWDLSGQPCSFDSYNCWDAGYQKRIPLRRGGGQHGASWSQRSLDGDAVKWQVVRLTRR